MNSKWNRVFLSLGNGEVQKHLPPLQRGALDKYLNFALRALTLLADEIIQPIAHFYVDATRKLTLNHLPLFQRGVARYILGPGVDSIATDIQIKTIEFPERISDFSRPEYIRQSETDIQGICLEQRDQGSVGEACASRWVELFKKRHSSELDDIGARLFSGSEVQLELDGEELRSILRSLPAERGERAFTWSYVSRGASN